MQLPIIHTLFEFDDEKETMEICAMLAVATISEPSLSDFPSSLISRTYAFPSSYDFNSYRN